MNDEDALFEMSQQSVSNDQLKEVSRLASIQRDLEIEIESREEEVKLLKQELADIAEKQLPQAMTAVGLKSFKLEDGSSVDVKPFYSASISDEKAVQAFGWLKNNGFEDLIKREIKVNFTAGEYEKADPIVNEMEAAGILFNDKLTVHPMTLKSFIKDQVEGGHPVPLDYFNAYIGAKATVKPPKA